MIQKFEKFLRDERIYTKFMIYMKSGSCKYQKLEDLRFYNPKLYVVSGFDWEATPEGVEYWSSISHKWNEIMKEMKK